MVDVRKKMRVFVIDELTKGFRREHEWVGLNIVRGEG